jgi:hypothetical protein
VSLLEEAEPEEATPGKVDDLSRAPAAPKRKRRTNQPLVETGVRRSPRIVELNDGYKSQSNCNDKKFLTCNAAPPTPHNKFVKNLDVSFCKVGEDGIEKKLLKRGKIADKDKIIGKPSG